MSRRVVDGVVWPHVVAGDGRDDRDRVLHAVELVETAVREVLK